MKFPAWKKKMQSVHRKHLYYVTRMNDPSLSPKQRAYASKRVKELAPIEMNLEDHPPGKKVR